MFLSIPFLTHVLIHTSVFLMHVSLTHFFKTLRIHFHVSLTCLRQQGHRGHLQAFDQRKLYFKSHPLQ